MKLTSYPPLSESTVVDGEEVQFIVCMDFDAPEARTLGKLEEVKCALWHDCGGTYDWTEEEMVQVNEGEVDVFSPTPSHTTLYFKHTLRRPTHSNKPLTFTLNYTLPRPRSFFFSSEPPTKIWANPEFKVSDGIIIFRPPPPPPPTMFNSFASEEDRGLTNPHTYFYIPGENTEWGHGPASLHRVSDTHGMHNASVTAPRTWVYDFNIPPNTSGEAGAINVLLGQPTTDRLVSWFALIKHGTAWIQPAHGGRRGREFDGFRPARDAILAAFQTDRGETVVFLPVSTARYTVYLRGDDRGRVLGVGTNDGRRVEEGKVVVVLGGDVEGTVKEAVYWAKRVSNGMAGGSEGGNEDAGKDTEKKATTAPGDDPWSDALKYCTWNSLGRNLTDRRILSALTDLRNNNIPIETLIIDDNWQTLDTNGGSNDTFAHRWQAFDADPAYFPGGLSALVRNIKSDNPLIKHIAVWHGILGYWNGISPTGPIANNYRLRRITNSRGETLIHVIDASDIHRFFDDFYAFLSRAGITAVKADTQCLLDERLPSADKGDLFPAYLSAWSAAAYKYFGQRAISCMSLVPQILYTNHLQTNLPKFTLRNSDDFFPHTPSSHPWHIFANAHNAVFTRELNVLSDWDMFQTKHEWSGYHSAARAISGGPIYITDDVGSHDLKIVRKVAARSILDKRRLVALRCAAQGRSMEYFRGFGEGGSVKIVNWAGPADYQVRLLGTFDLDGGRARTDCMVSLRDVVGDEEKGSWAVRDHKSGSVGVVKKGGVVKLGNLPGEMQVGGWDVVSVSPMRFIDLDRGAEVGVAVFGLLEQIAGAAALERVWITATSSTIKVGASLSALGEFGLFANYSERSRFGRVRQVTLRGVDVPERFVRIGEGSAYGNITVDVEGAWDYLRLTAREGDEVQVWVHLAV